MEELWKRWNRISQDFLPPSGQPISRIHCPCSGEGDAMQQCEPLGFVHVVKDRPDDCFKSVARAKQEAPAGGEFVQTEKLRFGDDVMQIRGAPFDQLVELRFGVELKGKASDLFQDRLIVFVTRALEIQRFVFGKKRVAVSDGWEMNAQDFLQSQLLRGKTLEVFKGLRN